MVGDDDSGPEDAEDDLDLECEACIWLNMPRTYKEPTIR